MTTDKSTSAPTDKVALKVQDKPAPKTLAKKGQGFSSSAVSLQKTVALIKKEVGLNPFDTPDTTLPFVSTGSSTIDILVGGTLARDGKSPLCPGFPRRRITEVYGPESSGKTSLALSSVAKLQRSGGSAIFIDFEHHVSKKYAIDIGVDWDAPTFVVIQPRTFEEGIKIMIRAIQFGVDLVVIDSVAAMVPEAEIAKPIDDPMKLGVVAALMAKFLPRIGIALDEFPKKNDSNEDSKEGNKKKRDPNHPGTAVVFLNQTRAFISTSGGSPSHGDAENTPGGKAVKFYSSLRLRLSRIKSETTKRKDVMSGRILTVPYGNLTHVKVVKSKMDGKQGHTSQIFIRYGHGVDDYLSVIEAGSVHKLIKKESGSWFSFNGERFNGRSNLRKYFITNPKAFEDIKSKIMGIVVASSKPVNPDEDLAENDDIVESLGEEDDDDLGIGELPEEVVESDDEEGTEVED